MRLFIALDIDDTIRDKIARFMDGVREFAPDARWARPESLHVTLKFIGQRPDEELPTVKHTLQTVQGRTFDVSFRDHGFFPTAKAPRVFWVGICAGPQLASLAAAIDTATSAIGVPREEHVFTPHLTLARRAGGSGAPRRNKENRSNPAFARLQEKLPGLSRLDFGTMTAREFFLYQSELLPGGSLYTKLCNFPLT